jgi:uncharacterized membrane protein
MAAARGGSADRCESQMLRMAENGFCVVANDRRGHGRPRQPWAAATRTAMRMRPCGRRSSPSTPMLEEAIMLGLTTIGTIHTAISLVALAAGFSALARSGLIAWHTGHGRVYAIATALTCLTGFGIFQRGGFNEAHMLGVVTLPTLGVAWLAARRRLGTQAYCDRAAGQARLAGGAGRLSAAAPPAAAGMPSLVTGAVKQ